MSDKLLTTKDVAILFNLSPRKVKNFLIKNDLKPINVSIGKKHVYRWLESAVNELLHNLHTKAQTKATKKISQQKISPKLKSNILTMSIADLHALTQTHVLQ